MSGEKDLNTLLRSMSPVQMEGEFVFCTFDTARYGDHANLNPVVSVQEAEGLTLVIPRHIADVNRIHYESTFAGITLNVHSSLEAIGLTAAFSSKLADAGLSANVIAGFYHDHLFVSYTERDIAMSVLMDMTVKRSDIQRIVS